MRHLKIGGVTLGEGLPKICIPLTGNTKEEIMKEAADAAEKPCQLLEWRADYYLSSVKDLALADVCRGVKEILAGIKEQAALPLIFTIRTKKEGGQIELDENTYFYLNQIAVESGMADIVDIETFSAPGKVSEENIALLVEYAHSKECKVMFSSHDFNETPDMEEMLTRYFVMQELGADLTKLAVMPQAESDVLNLLEVAALMRDQYSKVPFIAISMGELGLTTRVCGGEFGSVITFASGKNASAPGQMDAEMLQGLIQQYYGV